MAVLVAPLLALLVVEGAANHAPQAAAMVLLCRQQRRLIRALAQRAAMVPGRFDGVGAASQYCSPRQKSDASHDSASGGSCVTARSRGRCP